MTWTRCGRVAAGEGLVVVTGPAGAVATTVDGTLAAGGDAVVVVDPHAGPVDLAAELEAARRGSAPCVVLVADAPPDVLDQIVPAVAARCDERVRLVLTARPGVTDACLDPRAAALVAAATTRVESGEGPDDDRATVPERLAALSAPARAVLDAVTDTARLAVGGALGPDVLAALVGGDDPDPDVTATDAALAEALAEALAADLVRRVRRGGADHLAPHPAVVDLEDGPDGRPVPAAFGRRLRETLAGEPARLVAAGRVAVGRGDVGLAPALLGRCDPGELPVEAVWTVAVAAEERGHDAAALRRHLAVVDRDGVDPELAASSRRAAGLAAWRLDRGDLARRLLDGADDADRPVQDTLARLALAAGGAAGRDEARRRFTLAAAGADDLAAAAAAGLVGIALDDGDDEAALAGLRGAARSGHRPLAHRARAAVVPLLARLGQLDGPDGAQGALSELAAFLGDDDPAAWHADLARARTELAALRAAVPAPRAPEADGARVPQLSGRAPGP